jgi:hypothetical protein
MKHIDNYILERLNPRHLGSIKSGKFPIGQPIEVVENFLKEHGFDEIDIPLFPAFVDYAYVFGRKNARHYAFLVDTPDNTDSLLFADTSSRRSISETNKLYVISFDKYSGQPVPPYRVITGTNTNAFNVLSEAQFEKEMKEYFK